MRSNNDYKFIVQTLLHHWCYSDEFAPNIACLSTRWRFRARALGRSGARALGRSGARALGRSSARTLVSARLITMVYATMAIAAMAMLLATAHVIDLHSAEYANNEMSSNALYKDQNN